MLRQIPKRRITLPLLLAMVALIAGVLMMQKPKIVAEKPLNHEDLSRMVKPAVVRIVQHVTGSYGIPELELDLVNLKYSILKTKPETQQLDEYISGSGFVVNPNGHIVTNSHVVSKETISYSLISDKLQEAYQVAVEKLTKGELKKLYKDQKALEKFAQEVYTAIEGSSQFAINGEVVVLNPSSDKEDIEDLFKNGFQAEVASVNDQFFMDEKDVALLKINQTNLPAVPIAPESHQTVSGSQIFVFGFPATADFNKKNPMESTFTRGIISAIKFVDSKNFKVIQTDAKISQGSSGGPMFNDKGEVIGIITFQTGSVLREAGDNFAFAVPVSLATSMLKKNNVQNDLGSWRPRFETGLSYFYNNECEKSLAEFSIAKKVSFYFAPEEYLNYYINTCQQKIAAGESNDTAFRVWLTKTKQVSAFAWFVVVGRMLLVIIAVWVIYKIWRKIKREEKEIDELEEEVEKHQRDENQQLSVGVELPLPEEGLRVLRHHPHEPHPHLESYIKEARNLGMSDDLIIDDLKKAGWHDQDILTAINNS
jgi:S1-C subfamily serine protease